MASACSGAISLRMSAHAQPYSSVRCERGTHVHAACRRLPGGSIRPRFPEARSPWQNPYVERVIGSIRRERLDHIVIFNERHLRRVLTSYRDYYHRSRTHLSLQKDCPDPRPVQSENRAKVIAIEEVGGLHHRYERLAA